MDLNLDYQIASGIFLVQVYCNISKTHWYPSEESLKDVKTKSSNRISVISDYVLEILRERKAQKEIIREKLGHDYIENDLANCTDDGKSIQ